MFVSRGFQRNCFRHFPLFIANHFQETHIVPEAFVCLCYLLLALICSSGKFSGTVSGQTTERGVAGQMNDELERIWKDTIPCIATGYGLDDRGVGVPVHVGLRIFSSPRRPDQIRGPPNLLSNEYRGPFPRG
jgi:hypothetical protein